MTSDNIHTTTIYGQELRYAFFGCQDADRTLLLFNGIGASLETVEHFAEHFKKTRVLTLDVPGVGGSKTPVIPYRMHWLTRLTARLLDHLEISVVDVFGVSWGGGLAQQFVRDFPRRTRTLTLAATSAGFVMVPGNLKVISKMATPKRYTDPDHMMKIGPDIYGGQFRFNDELLQEHTNAIQSSTGMGYLFQLLAGVGWTSWLWLPQIKVPTLIIMGEDDPIVPVVNGRILQSRIPNSRLEIVECGHLFILSDPPGTAEMVEAFLLETPQETVA